MPSIFLNQFMLHGAGLLNDTVKVSLSHINVFEKEWGAIIGFLKIKNGEVEIPHQNVTYEVLDKSSPFEIMTALPDNASEGLIYDKNQRGFPLKLKDNKHLSVNDADRWKENKNENAKQHNNISGVGWTEYTVTISVNSSGNKGERVVKVRAYQRYMEMKLRGWYNLKDPGWKMAPTWYYYIENHFKTVSKIGDFADWIKCEDGKERYIHLHEDIIRNWLWMSDKDHIDSSYEEWSVFVYGKHSYGTRGNANGELIRYPYGINGSILPNNTLGDAIAWSGRKHHPTSTTKEADYLDPSSARCTYKDEPTGNGKFAWETASSEDKLRKTNYDSGVITVDGNQVPLSTKNNPDANPDWHVHLNAMVDDEFKTEYGNNNTNDASDMERGVGNYASTYHGDRFGGNRWQGRFDKAPGRWPRSTSYRARFYDDVSIGRHNYYNMSDMAILFSSATNAATKMYTDNKAFVRDGSDASGVVYDVTIGDVGKLFYKLRLMWGHQDSDSESGNQELMGGDVWHIYPNMLWKGADGNEGDTKLTEPEAYGGRYEVGDHTPGNTKADFENLNFGLDAAGEWLFDIEIRLVEFDSNFFNGGGTGIYADNHDNGPFINLGQMYKYPSNMGFSMASFAGEVETDASEYWSVRKLDTTAQRGPGRETWSNTKPGANHWLSSSKVKLNMKAGNPRLIDASGNTIPGWYEWGVGKNNFEAAAEETEEKAADDETKETKETKETEETISEEPVRR